MFHAAYKLFHLDSSPLACRQERAEWCKMGTMGENPVGLGMVWLSRKPGGTFPGPLFTQTGWDSGAHRAASHAVGGRQSHHYGCSTCSGPGARRACFAHCVEPSRQPCKGGSSVSGSLRGN